jgi:hypothetical protein
MIREAVEEDVTRGMSEAKSRKVQLFYSISRIYKWVHEMKLEHELIPNLNYREAPFFSTYNRLPRSDSEGFRSKLNVDA